MGCSLAQPHYQAVKVNVLPDGASLKVGNTSYTPPIEIHAPRNQILRMEASKQGYETAYKTVGYHLNGYGIMDIVGVIFFWPIIGVFTPGSRSLDETDVLIALKPSSKQTPMPQGALVPAPASPSPPIKGEVLARFKAEVPADTQDTDRTLANLTQAAKRKSEELGYKGFDVFMVSMSMESAYSANSKKWLNKVVGSFEVRK